MKKFSYILYSVLFLILLTAGCKSAKKSLKRGDFDDSVLRAVEKLKDSPGHASSIDILKEAYPNALEQHLASVKNYHSSNDRYKWEPLISEYSSLNRLYNAISSCSACMSITPARNFQEEEQAARNNAAGIRYQEAEELLQKGERESARKAYESFEKANAIIPGFRQVQKKLDMAYEIASFKVVVEQVTVTSKTYALSNAYFQDRVDEFLRTNRKLNKFVRFYTPQEATEARLKPDHVVTLQFDDFVVGQTLVEKNTETVTSKDSVKIGETTVGKAKLPIYDKVKAKLTLSRKTVHSAGLMDMQIRDFNTERIVNQEKFNGEYNWVCEWASFNGDERALTPAQLKMCKSQELQSPAPQQLFIEFSKPIYDRLTNKLRTFYAKY
jgi:tetratricopeptide (TPR) repeat protein